MRAQLDCSWDCVVEEIQVICHYWVELSNAQCEWEQALWHDWVSFTKFWHFYWFSHYISDPPFISFIFFHFLLFLDSVVCTIPEVAKTGKCWCDVTLSSRVPVCSQLNSSIFHTPQYWGFSSTKQVNPYKMGIAGKLWMRAVKQQEWCCKIQQVGDVLMGWKLTSFIFNIYTYCSLYFSINSPSLFPIPFAPWLG